MQLQPTAYLKICFRHFKPVKI